MVDITISGVFDLFVWTTAEWRLEGNADCEPRFSMNQVIYEDLSLPDCAEKSLEADDNVTITYVMEIRVKKTTGNLPGGQLRSYDHLYYMTCEYDSRNFSKAAFIPVVNKADNDSGMYSL